MPAKFLPPRTTTVIRELATPVRGEVLFDVDDGLLYIGDGVTLGGVPVGTGTTGVAASLYLLEVTNNITLTATNSNQLVIAKVSTAIITITLPAAPNDNDRVIIVDGNGNNYNIPTGFGLHKVVVNPNTGHTIQGYNSIDLDTELTAISLVFKTNRWFIYQATY